MAQRKKGQPKEKKKRGRPTKYSEKTCLEVMKIIKVPIEKCELWDKNPRGITKKDFDRLKRQIKKLGVYKPLVACEENGKYVILGGNMRLRALKELGFKEVELSVVDAKTEKEKIEYSLSDNDRMGYYDDERLAELIQPHLDEIDIDDFKVDIDMATPLFKLYQDFGPELDSDSDEDKGEENGAQNVCPKCGFRW